MRTVTKLLFRVNGFESPVYVTNQSLGNILSQKGYDISIIIILLCTKKAPRVLPHSTPLSYRYP